LQAATAGGAAALARGDIGRLAVGAVADLVVLDGDPLGDPRMLLRPGRLRLVLQAGVPVAGRDLDSPRLDGRAAPGADVEMPEPVGTPTCCLPELSSSRT
jgi:cytosine/adenosine deaminase-related metal-dependent hydrolase